MATARNPKEVFERQFKRTTLDVWRDFIQPEIPVVAQDIGQKTIFHAKKNHSFQNRTGALESSMRWKVRPVNGRRDVEIDIIAGGLGKVQFSRRVGKRTTKLKGLTPTGKPRKIPRRGRVAVAFDRNARAGSGSLEVRGVRQSKRRPLKRGDIVVVNYARAVEKKGYSVLKGSVEYMRPRIAKFVTQHLKGATARI